VARSDPGRVVGIVTRSDLIAAHGRRLDAERRREPHFRLPRRRSLVVGREGRRPIVPD
jgi:hypothetical protein